MGEKKRLSEMKIGETAVVERLLIHGSMRRRLLDLGLLENTEVTCLGRSPGGDPSAYLIRGALIALRRADAAGIQLERRGTVTAAEVVTA